MNKKNFFQSSLKFLNSKTTIVFLALVVFIFVLAPPVLAALDTGISYGTYTGLGTQDIRVTIMKIVRVVLGLVGVIALIIIIYGGYIWMTSAGNPEKIDQAKKILTNAVIGLVIILSAFAIVSFIIRALEEATGIPGIPGTTQPPTGCIGCGYLGGGIIEAVYPVPFAMDVPRDTAIIVTFKEEINPETIMAVANNTVCTSGASNPCLNQDIAEFDGEPSVKIYKKIDGEPGSLAVDQVRVTSEDMKTYIFKPIAPLGDSTNKHWYTTLLSSNLTKDYDNSPAFTSIPDYFAWEFEIGTKLDLIPPQNKSLFPVPDNESDTYSPSAGTQAEGRITVNKQPRIAQTADAKLITDCTGSTNPNCDGDNDITPVTNSDSLKAIINGTYNGVYGGTLELQIAGSFPDDPLTIISWDPEDSSAVDYYNVGQTYTIDSTTQRADLLRGLAIVFEGDSDVVNLSFSIELTPQSEADSLQVSSKVYVFVDSPTPADNEIDITGVPGTADSAEIDALVQNIKNTINNQTQNPNVEAPSWTGNDVNINAQDAGMAGNYINISATGDWAAVSYPESPGSEASISAVCSNNNICDQPRNVVIKLDFNEAMLPTQMSGKVVTDLTGDDGVVGFLETDDFDHIIVQADLDNSGSFDTDEYVPGTFVQSNQYKTTEFVSLAPCKDSDGNDIINSCGEKIYCLPMNPNEDYVKYKITVKAASIESCSNDSDCSGLGYEDGTATDNCLASPTVCGTTDGTIFFMKSDSALMDGLMDLSFNSLDGDKDGYTQGPQSQSGTPPYNLNDIASGGGDDFSFEFFINNKIDLEPPKVVSITPNVNVSGHSLITAVSATFNKLLSSSTVKPDSGYIDGKCTCNDTIDCPDSDQVCINGLCVNQSLDQLYCGEDEQCNDGFICQTKKYVSLIDLTAQRAAWWVSNFGDDINVCLDEDHFGKECVDSTDCGGGTCAPTDGYPDRSIAQIDHTPLLESTQYGGEMASGIEDIYQNCYVPGAGPTFDICDPWAGSGCCPVTAGSPYCCNGLASPDACTY